MEEIKEESKVKEKNEDRLRFIQAEKKYIKVLKEERQKREE